MRFAVAVFCWAVILLISVIGVALLTGTGCAPQYQEAPQAVVDELRFQDAWASDRARMAERKENRK